MEKIKQHPGKPSAEKARGGCCLGYNYSVARSIWEYTEGSKWLAIRTRVYYELDEHLAVSDLMDLWRLENFEL